MEAANNGQIRVVASAGEPAGVVHTNSAHRRDGPSGNNDGAGGSGAGGSGAGIGLSA